MDAPRQGKSSPPSAMLAGKSAPYRQPSPSLQRYSRIEDQFYQGLRRLTVRALLPAEHRGRRRGLLGARDIHEHVAAAGFILIFFTGQAKLRSMTS